MSYYLTYRPQTIGELDLTAVRQTLERWLQAKELVHAYLFYGPKGTGKTSAARIMAKVLNCERNQKSLGERKGKSEKATATLAQPCGECEACLSIQKGTYLAVIEMDAASNRGIDDIRQLKERINLAPAIGHYTVYVIDEVHMLTHEAFNALLKTLEEPPAHAVFVLCTTEPAKVPETIMSRCQVIAFPQATVAEVKQSLGKAIAGEKLTIEAAALDLIAQWARGSFRDGMKLLEQAAATGEKITVETVKQLTDHGSLYEVDDLIDQTLNRQSEAVIESIAAKEKAGADFSVLGERVVEELRARLERAVIEADKGLAAGPLLTLLEMVHAAVPSSKSAPIPAVPLEVALVKWCLQAPPPAPHKDRRDTPEEAQKRVTVDKGRVTAEGSVPREDAHAVAVGVGADTPGQSEIALEEVLTKWSRVMQAVKPLNHSIEALLRSARPREVRGDWLTIEVFYTFHKEQLEQERHRRIIEEVVGEVVEQPVKVKFVLGKKVSNAKAKHPDISNVTGQLGDEELAKAAEEIFS